MRHLAFFGALLPYLAVVRCVNNTACVPDEVIVKRLCKFICACGDPKGTLSSLENHTSNNGGTSNVTCAEFYNQLLEGASGDSTKTNSGPFQISVPSSITSNNADSITIPITIRNKNDNSEIGCFELSIKTPPRNDECEESATLTCPCPSLCCDPCWVMPVNYTCNSTCPTVTRIAHNRTLPCNVTTVNNTTIIRCPATVPVSNSSCCNLTAVPLVRKMPSRRYMPNYCPFTGSELRKSQMKSNPKVLSHNFPRAPKGFPRDERRTHPSRFHRRYRVRPRWQAAIPNRCSYSNPPIRNTISPVVL